MSAPKNTTTAHLALAGVSIVGTLCLAYAATGGRLASLFPESYFLNFTVFAFGAYGLGFFLVPKMILEMNFHKVADNYHEAVARCMGFIFLWNCYTIYTGMLGANTFYFTTVLSVGVSLFGPTWNMLYLDPIMTPSGAPPGNILFIIGGILAVCAK